MVGANRSGFGDLTARPADLDPARFAAASEAEVENRRVRPGPALTDQQLAELALPVALDRHLGAHRPTIRRLAHQFDLQPVPLDRRTVGE